VHLAHQTADHFPDGQIFVDLRGMDPRPLAPAAVLTHVLRALGIGASALPEDTGERAALYRSVVSDRRVLLVLDNATDEAQVRPLLPGTTATRVVITSRRRLSTLDAQLPAVPLDLLTPGEAVGLLTGIVGRARVHEEADEAVRIAALCGRLPLALRVAGARLAAKPHWPLSRLVERLSGTRNRLDELVAGDLAVRASLRLSADSLGEPQRRALRLLGGLWCADFTGWLAAAVLDVPVEDAEDVLEQLVDAQLLEAGAHRYQFHDLVRDFTREQFGREPPARRRDVTRRALDACVTAVHHAATILIGPCDLVPGGLPHATRAQPCCAHRDRMRSPAEALDWFATERLVLTSAVQQAADDGFPDQAWRIAHVSAVFFEVRADWDDWRHTHRVALRAIEGSGQAEGEAALRCGLGQLGVDRGISAEARGHLRRAETLSRQIGDAALEAYALRGLGDVEVLDSRHAAAVVFYETALGLARRTGYRAGEASSLRGLGNVYRDTGRYDEAVRRLEDAVAVIRDGVDRRTEPYALAALGSTHLLAGHPYTGIRCYRQALDSAQRLGDVRGEVNAARGLADAHRQAGRPRAAVEILQQVLVTVRRLGEEIGEVQTLRRLGEALTDLGESARAADQLRRALGIVRRFGFPRIEAEVLRALGGAQLSAGDREAARASLAAAHVLFRRCGMHREERDAERRLAAIRNDQPSRNGMTGSRPGRHGPT
jgi:tetratricopeptide (TPR) repeat protein